MRVKRSINNIIIGVISQGSLLLMNFITRTILIRTLGKDYLGIIGLFSNILAVLSLANLGIGSAIVYSLYKPLAFNDKEKINATMNYYKKAYTIIGLVIFTIGIGLMPFLHLFMKDVPNIPHINLMYFLYVFNSSVSYFFIYKSSIIIADQKNYVVKGIQCVFTLLFNAIEIIILILTKNYVLVLCINIIITILQNSYIAYVANKQYPCIKERSKAKLDKSERKGIFKNLFALSLYNLSGAVYNGTDNVVISSFLGISYVAIYSNYCLILNGIKALLNQIFHSFISSVGNLNVTESEEKKYSIFNVLYFMNFWVYGLAAICILVLINPFIELWIGENFLLSYSVVLIIVLDFFIGGLISSSSVFKNSSGLYWYGKYAPVICVIINLGLSLILVNYIGIAGVLIGTIVSRLATYTWVDPYVTFKYVLKKPFKNYWLKYFSYLFVVIFAGGVTNLICNIFTTNSIATLLGKVSLCIIIPNIIFYLIFKNTSEFKYIKNIIKSVLKKIIKK